MTGCVFSKVRMTEMIKKLSNYRKLATLFRYCFFLGLLFYPAIVVAQAGQLSSAALEPIRVQLRWYHQFQYAGYYAAKEKGFYEEAGFDVTLVAGSTELMPVKEVLAGRAQFGSSNGQILLSRLQGEALVALAAIFQHSPSVLITLASSGIKTPQDLIGRRIMSLGGHSDVSLIAMLHQEGIQLDEVELVGSSFQIQDLVDSKIDAFHGYLTNEPFELEKQGVLYNVINPRDYNIDFYSDILFTREDVARKSPERVERFRQATLKGWKYALAYPEEIIQLIKKEYNSEKSIDHLRFEALSVRGLMMPHFSEIGYINPIRIKLMAKVFLDLDIVDNLDNLDGLIFESDTGLSSEVRSAIVFILTFVIVLLAVSGLLVIFNRRLQSEIRERKLVEEKLETLAYTDPLTNLLNRRGFSTRYADELMRAQRYGDVFSVILIDLDLFKKVNDQYGHESGDRVLVSVADLLLKDTRETDFCGRFGGEEFILLLPNTSLVEATVYARRLCQHIGDNNVRLQNGSLVTITASAGVTEWLSEDKGEATIRRADQALYHAKNNGRNQVVASDFGLDVAGFSSE